MSKSIFGFRNLTFKKVPMHHLVEMLCPHQGFFCSEKGTNEEEGSWGQLSRHSASAGSFPHWGWCFTFTGGCWWWLRVWAARNTQLNATDLHGKNPRDSYSIFPPQIQEAQTIWLTDIQRKDKQTAAVRNSLLTTPFLRFWLCLILLQSPFSMSNWKDCQNINYLPFDYVLFPSTLLSLCGKPLLLSVGIQPDTGKHPPNALLCPRNLLEIWF